MGELELDGYWVCFCGNAIEDGLHCRACGKEPPWGCDCSQHGEEADDYDEPYPDDSPEAIDGLGEGG